MTNYIHHTNPYTQAIYQQQKQGFLSVGYLLGECANLAPYRTAYVVYDSLPSVLQQQNCGIDAVNYGIALQ